MENNNETCYNCSKPLPSIGFFCGTCLTQFKCKTCGFLLEKENKGCTNCGTPKEEKVKVNYKTPQQGVNTFHIQETLTERVIEATFSDKVGKDLTGFLRDAFSIKKGVSYNPIGTNKQIANSGTFNDGVGKHEELHEAELLDQEKNSPESLEEDHKQFISSPQSIENKYPTLDYVAMKNWPSTEPEWIVVYSLYASNFGQKKFTRQDIIEKYIESGRLDTDKRNALSGNIRSAIQSGYINPLNSDYSLLDKGIKKANEILNRTTSSTPKYKSSSKSKTEKTEVLKETKTRKTSNGGKNPKRINNIDFEPDGKESLKTFFNKYSSQSDKERYLLFVYYMQEILEIPEITYDHIYTCFDTLDLRISESLNQTVRNAASRTGWIEIKNSIITITVKGKNKIKAWNNKN